MTKVDQFESVFRSAAREPFRYRDVDIASVLVITDLPEYEANLLADELRTFLAVLDRGGPPTWTVLFGDSCRTVRGMLEQVERCKPDLICTYRHLHSEGWRWPFTLGDHAEVLTQATSTPVLLLPHPEAGPTSEHAIRNTDRVMAITDHLTGDHRLVSFAASLTQAGGTLLLSHVEDRTAYDRCIEAISKLPEIDTDVARESILRQLMKDPSDYIDSCRTSLLELDATMTVDRTITLGRRLAEYVRLVDEHELDLLVFNTKDEDQLAMHGLAYPLAVELRQIPLVML